MPFRKILLFWLVSPLFSLAQPSLENSLTFLQLPDFKAVTPLEKDRDWLVHPIPTPTAIYRDGEKDLVLTNGLLLRRWRLAPDLATTHLTLLTTGENFLRGVKPEARLVLDGDTLPVGGLTGQPEYGYLLTAWLDSMRSNDKAFHCTRFETAGVEPLLKWEQKRWAGHTRYPAPGKRLTFFFEHPQARWKGVEVAVHYEMYDGIPLLCKWLTIRCEGHKELKINDFESEILAVREEETSVDHAAGLMHPNLLVQTDYSFHDMSSRFSNQAVDWLPDPDYTSQVNYLRQTPCLLSVSPTLGPGVTLPPGETFETFRTWILPYDSHDRERKGLSERRFYRAVAPWSTENPIFMHLTSTDPAVIRTAIDQCAEVGFEMVIISFGSGFVMEDVSATNILKFKELANYAHSKGIGLGGYSLFSSRSIDEANDCINPATGKPGGAIFGNAPCLASEWGIRYIERLETFLEETGFDLLEHDGPYPGDVCASTTHPGHEGLEDSQWWQWEATNEFYRWLRAKGIYLNAPDWYFLNGSNKTGIGYREVNWSLPRERQIMLGRQNIFDGTWTKIPSMGWTFTPLVEYHGGGKAATLEPLHEHLAEYRAHLWQNFGSGVQSCYRGPRLFDTEETRLTVKAAVDWYKYYRKLLNSDIIHLRRPDGQDWDGILHVNPFLEEKGLAMLYNPLKTSIRRKITLPLYYTGLTENATIKVAGATPRSYPIDRDYEIEIEVEIPAEGFTWLTIE
jgi:hypothetical protein